MNHETQMLKGILEGCLLGILEREELYGYAAVEKLSQFGFEANEATVYPILSRLQAKGLLHTHKQPSPYGPMRKYYALTKEGAAYLTEFRHAWTKIRGITDIILECDIK